MSECANLLVLLCLAVVVVPGRSFLASPDLSRAARLRSNANALLMSTGVRRVLVTGGNKGIGKAICGKLMQDYPEVCESFCKQCYLRILTDSKNVLTTVSCSSGITLLRARQGSCRRSDCQDPGCRRQVCTLLGISLLCRSLQAAPSGQAAGHAGEPKLLFDYNRIEMLELDTSLDESVELAASMIARKYGKGNCAIIPTINHAISPCSMVFVRGFRAARSTSDARNGGRWISVGHRQQRGHRLRKEPRANPGHQRIRPLPRQSRHVAPRL